MCTNNKRKYIEKYNMDEHIFNNSNEIYLYLEHILNDNNICDKLIEILDDNQILSVLKKFLNVIPKFCINDQHIIYTKLSSISKIRTVIAKYDNTKIFYELIKPITDIEIYKTDIWEKYITNISNIIKLLFIEKKNETMFIEWSANIFNNNIERINISPIDHNFEIIINKEPTNLFLINLLGIIYQLWITEYDTSKIKKIKYSYVSDIKCPIRWYLRDPSIDSTTKQQLNNKTTNFLTQYFFLLLQGLRVVFIPLINRINEWEHYTYNHYDEDIYNDPLTFMLNVAFMLKHGKVDKIIKNINILLSNDTIINWVDDFYNACIYWIKVCDGFDGLFNIDDILRDFAIYILYRHDTIQKKQQTNNNSIVANQKYIDKYIFKFALNIIKSKKYTKNIDIRFKYFQIATRYLHSDIIITMLGYCESLTIISDEYFFNKIIHYSIVLYNDIGNIDDINSDFNYLSARHEILNVLGIIYNKYINIDNILNYVMSKNKYLLIYFVNIIINNINTLSNKFNELYMLQYNRNDNEINEGEPLYQILLLCELHMVHIMKLIKYEIIVNNMIAYELSSKMLTSIILCIKNIVTIYDFTYQNHDFTKIIEYILQILDTLIFNNKDILNKIIYDPNYDINYFNKIKTYLSNYNLYSKNKHKLNKYKRQIIKLINKLKGTHHKQSQNILTYPMDGSWSKPTYPMDGSRSNPTYPDEFLDPLLFTLIKNPVLLPGMDKFKEHFYLDRSTIYRHLLNIEQNPFNRNKLTIDELDEYNNRSEIKKKNKCFKSKIDAWIKKNKN